MLPKLTPPTAFGIPLYFPGVCGWEEPGAARREIFRENHSAKMEFVQTGAIFVGIFALLAVLNSASGGKPSDLLDAISGLLVFFGVILFLVLPVVVRLNSSFPRTIRLFENRIERGIGRGSSVLWFEELSEFDWEKRRTFNVLVLKTRKTRIHKVCVPLDVSIDEVSGFLESRRILKCTNIQDQTAV
ncbi:MAG: hypothetical protein HY302_02335 [Opitutae bacterium]|nr:hypothetical protein [Opitutae bacterium]